MRAKIENGKVVLPREVLLAAALPENGECEVAAKPGEIRLTGQYPPPPELVRFLQAPPVVLPIDEIVAAEEPDVD